MPSKLIDVPSSSGGTPALFGNLPGWGISQHVGPQAAFNNFGYGDSGGIDRWVSYATGIGDILREVFAATNWADTGLFYPAFDGGSRASGSAPRPVGFNPPAFCADIIGSFSALGGRGDDGLACYDATPTSGAAYSAMYLGNQCDTRVGAFTLGQLAAAPSFGAFGTGGTIDRASGDTASYPLKTQDGVLNVIAFERNQDTTDDLPTVPGWTKVYSPVDGTPPGDQTLALTVYYRIWRRGDNPFLTITYPTAFTGAYIGFYYLNVAGVTAVIGDAVAPTDGTNADCPGVTTSTFNNTVVGIVTKLAPDAGSGFAPPAGWTLEINARLLHPVGADSHWIGVVDKVFAAATATGTISLTGASASFGSAVTLILDHGDGLTSAATSGNVSFEGLGFQPDLILFLLCDPEGAERTVDGTAWMYGAADAALNQWVTAARSVFGSGSAAIGGLDNRVERSCRFHDDACLAHIGAPAFAGPTTNDVVASLVSMDADGFTLDITAMTAATTAACYFMAVKAQGGSTAFAVGTGQAPASNGATTVSGLPFEPDALVVGSAQTIDTALQGLFGAAVFGMTDGVTQRAFWNQAATGAFAFPAPDTPLQWWGDGVLTFADCLTATMLAHADLQSFNADGFTLDWPTTDGNEYLYGWVAMVVGETPTPKPVALTLDPVILGFNAYTFRGLITPNTLPGDNVTYFFEYGATTSYGNVAPATPTSDGDGTTPTPVSINVVAGFSPIHYRLVVVTADGCRINGNDVLIQVADVVFGNRFRIEAA